MKYDWLPLYFICLFWNCCLLFALGFTTYEGSLLSSCLDALKLKPNWQYAKLATLVADCHQTPHFETRLHSAFCKSGNLRRVWRARFSDHLRPFSQAQLPECFVLCRQLMPTPCFCLSS
ncbi:hypothetical protein DL98DRAFT_222331 [Cadophora sp. DSE1049]|nr:hypothetical protein DL98DRAFT_222331 [Cadophora sp. DSE1049]